MIAYASRKKPLSKQKPWKDGKSLNRKRDKGLEIWLQIEVKKKTLAFPVS